MLLLATFWAELWQCLHVIWIDSTFAGKAFIAQIKQQFGWTLEHLKRSDEQLGFQVILKRWVVERTYSWFGHYRRLSKDYEFLPTTSELMLFAAMVHLMVRRLEPKTHTR
jgi:putative transposase